ncbi:hypothetical protein AWENTII_006986 [Aspergillus wentii]
MSAFPTAFRIAQTVGISGSFWLSASADNSSTAKDSEIDQLLNRWKVLNGIRGLWPLAGGLLGLAAVFC